MRNNKYFIDLNKGCCNLLLANHFQTWDPKLQVLVFLFLIREYRLLFTKYLILFVCFLISFESLSEKYMAFLCSYYRFDIKREKWKEIQNFNFFKFLRLFFFYYWLLVAVRKLFGFKRGSHFEITHIWKAYRIFIFNPNSMRFFHVN